MSRLRNALRLDKSAHGRAWAQALMALGLGLLALAVPMSDPALRLYDLWMNNDSYGHGILIVPVMLYLLWATRADIAHLEPVPSFVGVGALALVMSFWFGGRMLGIVMVEQLALVAALLAVSWAILGRRVTRRTGPISLYLLCAVPIWSYLIPILQDHTALASTAIVRALGVPVYLEGLYLTIPDGRFVVADVCAGLRFLLAALSLAGFYALLNLRRVHWQLFLIAASFVLSIVFNWVRVVGIVYIGHHTQMQSALVSNHYTYGWLLFLFVVVGILLLGRMLESVEGGRPRAAPAPIARAGKRWRHGSLSFLLVAAAVGVLSLAPVKISSNWLTPFRGTIALGMAPDWLSSGWRLDVQSEQPWRPDYRGADAERLLTFENVDEGAPRVDLFVAYYAFQRQDAEVVSVINRLYESDKWRQYDIRSVPDRVEVASGVVAEEFLIRAVDGPSRRLVWRANWINGRFVTGQVDAKVQELHGLIAGNRAAAALVLSTPIELNEQDARARLREFAAQHVEVMLQILRTAKHSGDGEHSSS